MMARVSGQAWAQLVSAQCATMEAGTQGAVPHMNRHGRAVRQAGQPAWPSSCTAGMVRRPLGLPPAGKGTGHSY